MLEHLEDLYLPELSEVRPFKQPQDFDMIVIPGYSDYIVTSNGYVYSTKTNQVLTMDKPDKQGYYRVSLINDHGAASFTIHRLVALAFIDKVDGCYEVNHINGIKKHNDKGNLEWVTSLQNIHHAMLIGLRACNDINNLQYTFK